MGTAEEFISHHGILGMKWGIRRRSSSSSGLNVLAPRTTWHKSPPQHSSASIAKTPRALRNSKIFAKTVLVTKNHSEDSAQAKAIASKAKTHGHQSLTNEEMKKLVARFNLEKQYAQMAAEQKQKKKGKFHKMTVDVISNVGKQHMTTILLGATTPHATKVAQVLGSAASKKIK